jgi:hypothetical protein
VQSHSSQVVGWTTQQSYDCAWMVQPVNPDDGVTAEGIEVQAGGAAVGAGVVGPKGGAKSARTSHPLTRDAPAITAGVPFVLLHCATNTPLCLEACAVPSDFGAGEREVSAHLCTGAGHQPDKPGHVATALARPTSVANHWRFVTAV